MLINPSFKATYLEKPNKYRHPKKAGVKVLNTITIHNGLVFGTINSKQTAGIPTIMHTRSLKNVTQIFVWKKYG